MARTLDQLDTDLAKLEAAVVALRNKVDNVVDAGAALRSDVTALADGARKIVRVARREVQRARSEIAVTKGKTDAEQDRPKRPGRNPMVEMVRIKGKTVARSRLAR